LGAGGEGCGGAGPARVRGDRLCGGGSAASGGCERQADDFDHWDCQGYARGDRGATASGEVWGDAGEGEDRRGERFQDGRFDLR